MTYRRAGPADLPSLVELRLDFMRIVKDGGLPDEASWRAELSELFARDMAEGRLVCWICLDGDAVVGASGIAFEPPRRAGSPGDPTEALILNMYTRPAYRRRGIAAELLRRSIEEGRARGLRRLRLQPTADGRALYERSGFRPAGKDMVLELG